jgi:hypothetical protein
MLNLHDACRVCLDKQALCVHTATPVLVQVHVLQSFCQVVPGVQVSVQRQ